MWKKIADSTFDTNANAMLSVGEYHRYMYHDTYLDTKKVSSTKYHEFMIHFWYCISISINDTFQVYQYHKSLIHDCDTFTGIQNSLLTRFAISVMNSWSRVSTTVSRILIPRHARYRQIVKLKTIWLRHSAINWLSNQAVDRECINYLSDTDTQLKMLARYGRIRKVFIKFNTTIPSSAPVKRLFSMARQIEVPCRNHLSDSMLKKLLLMKANDSLF